MRAHEFITEAATSIVYHYMPAGDAVRTLLDNHYSLESSTGMSTEQDLAPKGKPWYLATTRSKVGDYHIQQTTTSGVMFVLDGNWLNQRYETYAVDYWKGTNRQSEWNKGPDARTSESEDRVFSASHIIPLRGSTTAIHVFLLPLEKQKRVDDDTRKRQSYRAGEIKEVIRLASGRGIPVYLYDDKKNWMTQAQHNRIDPNSEYGRQLLTGKIRTVRRDDYESDYFAKMKFWVEIIEKNDESQLSDPAKKLVIELRNGGNWTTKLIEELSNYGRRPADLEYQYIIAINRFMTQNKINTIDKLQDYLKKKWSKK